MFYVSGMLLFSLNYMRSKYQIQDFLMAALPFVSNFGEKSDLVESESRSLPRYTTILP